MEKKEIMLIHIRTQIKNDHTFLDPLIKAGVHVPSLESGLAASANWVLWKFHCVGAHAQALWG